MADRAISAPKKSRNAPLEMEEQSSQQTTIEEQIRCRAHQIYLERGSQDGSALDDWLQAEREILSAPVPEEDV
jgi:hypothetical protein